MISFIGEPNEVQEALIDRAVVLQHQIELMDAERMKAGGRMSDCAKREYLGWSNSLVRTLKQLGMEGLPASTKPTDKKFWTYEYVAKQKDIPA